MPPRRKVKPRSIEHAALGQAIRELRLKAHLTQEQLADRIGTTFTRIGQLERGATDPKFTTICRLARGLDVKPAALVERFDRILSDREEQG